MLPTNILQRVGNYIYHKRKHISNRFTLLAQRKLIEWNNAISTISHNNFQEYDK